ncbi:MAG: MMPL family transporter [Methyloceanibacter sp.]|nr:MMPL family transporter [Methyloceanibacter sp.]
MKRDKASPSRTRLYRCAEPILALGDVTARFPKLALMAFLLLSGVMAGGLFRVVADDALDEFLQAPTADYRAFEALRESFPASDLDAYLAVDGSNLLSAEHLWQMQEVAFELLLLDSVDSVVSMFSLREPLTSKRLPAPIIPDDLASGNAKLESLGRKLDHHPLAQGRLISSEVDGNRLALFLVALNRASVKEHGLPSVVRELEASVARSISGSDLRVGLSGMPLMKAEVIDSTRRDIIVFNGIGILVGVIILALFFRQWQLVVIAIAPALFAVLWTLGLMGWARVPVDPLMSAIMPLVLVVTLNNAMHFLFATCRSIDAGASRRTAIDRALVEVGPACALTSVTTSVALLSMAFSSSSLIRTFGIMASVSILSALGIVIALMPMLIELFLKDGRSKYLGGGRARVGVRLLDSLAAAIGDFVAKWPKLIALSGVGLTAVFAVAYMQLDPRFRLSDMLPDQGSSAPVLDRIEDRLGGLFPLNVLVQWPDGTSAQSAEVRTAIRDVHHALERHVAISKVNSFYDLQRWAETGGLSPKEASRRLNEAAPQELLSRFINERQRGALVSGYINDLEAKEVLALSQDLEPALDKVREAYPAFTVTLTGLTSLGASRSSAIISQLSLSMLSAVFIVIAVIGLAFGSIAYAGLSAVPNLFALFATGALLFLVQGGLDYATVVGLTVAFGLAVDDTIHVLHRFELEVQRSQNVAVAIHRSICVIGTVLILTTLVLIAGMLVTQISVVPPTRQFGLICVSTLIFALLADLFVLPALVLWASRWIDRSRRAQAMSPGSPKARSHGVRGLSEERGQ